MARTVIGLFNSAAQAQQAVEQLLAANFARSNINIATPDTLRAQHLPADPGGSSTLPEPFEEGIVRFFSNLFVGNENDDAQAHIAATHPESAVVTVNAATDEEAERARAILDSGGAVDVYRQAQRAETDSGADNTIDLSSSLSHVRDDDQLDANGLTTH